MKRPIVGTRNDALIPAPVGSENMTSALIVDDNKIDQRRLKSLCDKADLSLDFTTVETLSAMKAALGQRSFDIIFIDYRLDDGDGIGALNMIKKDANNRDAATIMIAGVAQTTIAVTALKSGCDDYILKDALDQNWLRRAVASALDKSRLKREFNESELLRTTLSAVLTEFSKSCTTEMKPILSRMLRQIRSLRRTTTTQATSRARQDIQELEVCCSELWEYIEGFEQSAIEACDVQFSPPRQVIEQRA